ncbi:helicase associated domain-containing protein [Tabrizicola sp.]|uniref:helicase associated domain-containing protein n=1 Tax=Tabrizicola sp. TaxID=2005166 RepID=UPI003D2D9061
MIDFIWDVYADSWEEGFSKLLIFKAREGHCKVPGGHVEDGFGLGQWVSVQRRQQHKITVDRRQRLDSIGFVWNALAANWDEAFEVLSAYRFREGHCNVPQKHIEHGFNLGAWVGSQRIKKAKLVPERLGRLNAIGFVWSAK